MIGELTNHLWQSTLFAAVAGLLAIALRKNWAQVRYWLWFSASFKFLVPFSLLMNAGSHLKWAPGAKIIAAPAISFAIEQVTQPFPDTVSLAPSTAGSVDWAPLAIPLIMIAVWTCGFFAIARIRFRGWLRIRAAMRSSTPIDIPAPVEVRSSPGLLEPGMIGLFRPVLLLPAGIEERLTPPQLEAVLTHELCHVRRRDNLLASIHMIVEATFWFHPLVWWIGAKLVEERERACDEEVLRLGSEPRVYAEGILSVCKLYVESPLVCVSGVTGSDLKKRIEAIMTNRIVLRLNVAKKVTLAVAGMAAVAAPIVVGMLNAPSIRAQTAGQSGAAAKPQFEVASIRPCKGEGGGGGKKSDRRGGKAGGGESSPGRLNTGCSVLVDANNLGLIQRAYVRFANGQAHGLGIVPIKGGPAWIHSDLYVINAKAEGTPSQEMMQGPMLQALLEDRFKLKIHRETREIPVYALTVAKSGSKLKPFKEGSCTSMPLTFPPAALAPGQRYCKAMVGLIKPAVEAEGSTLAEFSKLLELILDRPVMDTTGIMGRFDIHLEFAPDESTPRLLPARGDAAGATLSDPAGAPIFTAIQEQLGLKLVPAKGPGEFLVIDRVERPSEN
jgi:bla regulator protein BlaR1